MKEELKKIRLHPEAPIEVSEAAPFKNDRLGFQEPVERVCSIMDNIETPFTLGIYGAWGSGKTSFMKMMQVQLEKDGHKTFWFDAWQYENETSLMLPLMSKLAKELKEQEGVLAETIAKVKRGAVTLTLVAGNVAMRVLSHGGAGLKDVKEGYELSKEEEFEKIYDSWISVTDKFKEDFEELVKESKDDQSSMVIFIDDLDRCMPENTIKLIENIKHFLSAKGCIFVIGADKGVLSKGIEAKYGSNLISGDEYLEKIVSLSFDISKTIKGSMTEFVCEAAKRFVDPDWYKVIDERVKEFGKIISLCAVESNPRKIKNVIKRFLLFLCIEDKRGLDISVIAALVIMHEFYPAVYRNKERRKIIYHPIQGPNFIEESVKIDGESFRKEWEVFKTLEYMGSVLKDGKVEEQAHDYFYTIEFLYSLS